MRGRGCLAGLLLVAAAAGGVRGEPLVLDIPVFAGGFGTDFYSNAARQFEALRPGVRVNVYGDPRIHDQIRVRAMDGNYPDAACAAYVPWPTLIRAGRIVDLTAALAGANWECDARWGGTFLPGALDNWRIGGRVYGLPVSYACWTIFYNRALFREHGWTIPKTWDEFFALGDRIRATGLAPLSVPGTRWLYADAFFRSAYFNLTGARGWSALEELTPGARADPRFARAAAIEQRVTSQYALRGWQGETHTGAELAFVEGRAAMTVSGSWLSNEMGDRLPRNFELGAMNFPVSPDGIADPSTIQVSSDCFFVFATGHPEREKLTLEFLRFLTSRTQAAAFVRRFDSPAAVRGVPAAAFSPRMRQTAELIERAHAAFPMWQVMLQPTYTRQAFVDASSRLTTGSISPARFSAEMEAAATQDRDEAAHPNDLKARHPIAGWLLLAGIAALLALPAIGWRRTRRTAPVGTKMGHGNAALFVLPSLLLFAALVLVPAAVAVGWAFTAWDGISQRSFVGWANFRYYLFGTDLFWQALRHNLFLMVVPAVLVVPVSLGAAALLHHGVRGARFFRSVFLFPNLLGGIAATLIWLAAYAPHGGLVNAALALLGRVLHVRALAGFDGFPWLSVQHLYLALLPIYLWLACGFNLVLYLAAMEGIDPQLYEAASLDGASPLRQFFTITLPLIREVLLVSAVFLVIGGLNAFEMIWLLTQQDPSADVHTLATLLVSTLFKDFAVGRAAALAVILFLLVFGVSGALLRWFRPEPDEN